MDRRQLARPRVRRRLYGPMNMANAAIAIQAAARGFLARRRAARMGARRQLMSPMDIKRKFTRVKRPQALGQAVPNRVFPKARIGTLIGTEKSKRKASMKKLDPLEVKLHVDTHNTVMQPQVAYFGFPDAGSQDEQLKQGCIALTNLFFRRSGIKTATIKTVIENAYSHLTNVPPYYNIKLRKISILFVKWDADGSGNYSNADFAVDKSNSLEDIALSIYNSIKQKAVNEGQWPIVAKLWSLDHQGTADAIATCFATYDLMNTMVDFAYMRKYKWQNITPSGFAIPHNVTGHQFERSSINDVQANPLSGRIYKFKGPTPLIRSMVQDQQGDQMPSLDLIQRQGQGTLAHDYLDTRAFRFAVPDNSYDNNLCVPFKQPFKAASVFKNTMTEDKVYMPPGGYKQLIRKEKVTMNFNRFCHATVFDSNTVATNPGYVQPKTSKIGTCTLFALEPAVRTANNEVVRVLINSELWFTTKCRVADKKQPVISNVKVEDGYRFGEPEPDP